MSCLLPASLLDAQVLCCDCVEVHNSSGLYPEEFYLLCLSVLMNYFSSTILCMPPAVQLGQ